MTKYETIEHLKLPEAYNPAGPVTKLDMFKGRADQLQSVLECIFERGQSVIVYGERGVGKTSLASVVFELIQSMSRKMPNYWYGSTTSHRASSFSDLWSQAFENVRFTIPKEQPVGFGEGDSGGGESLPTTSLREILGDRRLDPSVVAQYVKDKRGVWIFDEFNLLASPEKDLFSDLMKTLSDLNSYSTVVLVCVADDVWEVIEAHESIERCTKQILMPRMHDSELREILRRGEEVTGMEFEEKAESTIIKLSQGLPYFTHYLAKRASLEALQVERLTIEQEDSFKAIEHFVQGAQESLKESYRRAVHSKSPQAIHAEVLLACALAERDSFGLFTISAVADSMSRLRRKKTTPGVFASHMGKFSTEDTRGRPLSRKGVKGSYVYKFSNPLLQPYVVLRGISEKRLAYKDLAQA